MTSDVEVLQTYLALWGSATWRGRHGLAMLTDDRLVPTAQYVVVDEGGSLRTVRRADGTGAVHRVRPSTAGELAVALAFPLDVVAAAIRHPTGEPIWRPGRSSWWARVRSVRTRPGRRRGGRGASGRW